MREILAAVVVPALLATACDARTGAPAPAEKQPASTASSAAASPAPAPAPAGGPRSGGKSQERTRVAQARHTTRLLKATAKKVGATDTDAPAGAPAVTLNQSPPSSY